MSPAGGRHRLVWLTDAPQSYFAGEIPRGLRIGDEPRLPQAVPASVRRRAARVIARLGVDARPAASLAAAVDGLVAWFRAFEPGDPPRATELDLRGSGAGAKGQLPPSLVRVRDHGAGDGHPGALRRERAARVRRGDGAARRLAAHQPRRRARRRAGRGRRRQGALSAQGRRSVSAAGRVRQGQRRGRRRSRRRSRTRRRTRRSGRRLARGRRRRERQRRERRRHERRRRERRRRDGGGGRARASISTSSIARSRPGTPGARVSPATVPTTRQRHASARATPSAAIASTSPAPSPPPTAKPRGLPVEIYLDGPGGALKVGDAVTDDAGAWRATIEVPRDLPLGDHRVVARTPGDATRKPSHSR